MGINGSGKTSILAGVTAILSRDLSWLCTNRFSELGVELVEGHSKIRLWCTQEGSDFYFNGKFDSTEFTPFHVKLKQPSLSGNSTSRDAEESSKENYRHLGPEAQEEPLWNALRKIRRPLAVFLDRTISVQSSSPSFSDAFDGRTPGNPTNDPLRQVERLARDTYTKFLTRLARLNDSLKNRLITSSFTVRPKQDNTAELPTLAQIEAVENKLLNRISTWTENVNEIGVRKYFERMKSLIKTLNDFAQNGSHLEAIKEAFSDELHRVSSLFDSFEDFENASANQYEPIKNYLETLNGFLKDTGKEIKFSELTKVLYFTTNTKKYDGEIRQKNLSLLSSGERQLIILLTYIAFPPLNTNIVIIDEPELSLHPSWQANFMEKSDKLLDQRSQLIIATHSPEIVGKRREFCIEI